MNSFVSQLVLKSQQHYYNGEGSTELHGCAKQGDHTGAAALLASGNPLNLKDRDGNMALHLATTGEVAQALLQSGKANLIARGGCGRAPVHVAAAEGRAGVLQQLLAAGASHTTVSRGGVTALHDAATGEVAALLADAGADVHKRNAQGRTPLHVAVERSRDGGVLQALVSRGAKLEVKDRVGYTPLHLAKEPVAVQLLCRAGADVNSPDGAGESAVYRAARGGAVDLLDSLLTHAAMPVVQEESQPLLHAAGDGSVVRVLLEHGHDRLHEDSADRTALFVTAREGRISAFKELLRVSTREEVGVALHRAVWYNRPDVTLLLLAYGAQPDARNARGLTPLHVSARYDRDVLLRLLLRFGADPNAKVTGSGTSAVSLLYERRDAAARPAPDAEDGTGEGGVDLLRPSSVESLRYLSEHAVLMALVRGLTDTSWPEVERAVASLPLGRAVKGVREIMSSCFRDEEEEES